MNLHIDMDREEDGRWIAEVATIPGALAYGATEAEARANVTAIALRVIADDIENAKQAPDDMQVCFDARA